MAEGISPRIAQEELGLKPDDPVLERFTAISDLFDGLRLPLFALPPERADALILHERYRIQGSEEPNDPPDFSYGPDYFFGQYKGNPSTISQNAEAAVYHGNQGIPVWAVLKSVAFAIPNSDRLVIVHLRGDRQVDKAKLCSMYRVEDLPMADEQQLDKFGLVHGTVNPLIADSEQIDHVYDKDLVDGDDYPGSDVVFTSSGDRRFYVGFNVRKFIMGKRNLFASQASSEISIADEKSPKRIIARRPIYIVGGDSPDDAMRYGQVVARDITDLLIEHHQYFGDQSLPRHLRVFSESAIAGSIDTRTYGPALQAYVRDDIVPDLTRKLPSDKGNAKPLVAYGSFAMEGIAGDQVLSQVKEIEYIGSRAVVETLLTTLQEQGVKPTYNLLLSLSSVYDSRLSAFAGKILDEAPKVSDGVANTKIQPLVYELKQKEVKDAKKKFFQLVESILRGAENARTSAPNLDALKGQTVVVILGASELEGLMDQWDQIPEPTPEPKKPEFEVIRSNDPTFIKEATENLRASGSQKIALVCVSPKRAVARTIAEKTLGIVA